ncbi:hypothetical protein T10_7950 [Trichinella papuae]|uniref:Uncharacterized protein n=1 Tax=Trichinella papuae TaxID=268474 RepID=A0A0V1MRM0_9BILA|nr:hypothetical protein T10_7950 [Trichinella papuae]
MSKLVHTVPNGVSIEMFSIKVPAVEKIYDLADMSLYVLRKSLKNLQCARLKNEMHHHKSVISSTDFLGKLTPAFGQTNNCPPLQIHCRSVNSLIKQKLNHSR